MADLTFAQVVQRQLRLLQHICETLTARALAGSRADLDNLFATQDRLEHWLQYQSLGTLDVEPQGYEAPPPLPGMRPGPPLPHEEEIFTRAREAMAEQGRLDEAEPRPRVTFPPEPLWVEDLERGPVDEDR